MFYYIKSDCFIIQKFKIGISGINDNNRYILVKYVHIHAVYAYFNTYHSEPILLKQLYDALYMYA